MYKRQFLGAGVGAGFVNAFQRVAGQLALFSGGIYAVTRTFSSIVRDRARVQRLETGVRDLTDQFRQQAILPRLQEVALLPGLDYVTATQAFTRALSGGFTDQQSLRLINQIRNAVALSQGSIEDTNEVLRQFIQIQARGRFDQENLRPILERAPFIRRVIQEEFGTQIGGDIQAVLESRGETATEGILAIVERLAQGPIADPTTLQNALDNVGNELILLRNELGRRIEPVLRSFTDNFTGFIRAAQGPEGQVASSVLGGAILFGGGGLISDIIRRRRPTDFLTQVGYNRFLRQPSGRAYRTTELLRSRLGEESISGDFLRQFRRDPEFASQIIQNAQGRFDYANNEYLQAFQRGRPTITRDQAEILADVTPQDRFIRDSLLLNRRGEPSAGRRFTTAVLGRRGERLRPFGIRGFRNPITPQGLRSPLRGIVGSAGLGAALLSLPGLIAIGAAGFGGATLGQTAFERAGRSEELGFLDRAIIGSSESARRLTGRFNQLSDATQKLITGGIENFNTLLSSIASGNASLLRSFRDLQLQTRGDANELTLNESQLVTGNPLLEAVIRQTRISPGVGFGDRPDFTSAETRTGTLAFFAQRQLLLDQIEQATEQAATERANIDANIGLLERRRSRIDRPEGRRSRSGDIIFSRAERRRLEEIEEINKQIREQESNLEKVNNQERLLVRNVQRLRDQYDELGRSNATRLLRLEDVIGNIRSISPRELNLGRIFSEDCLLYTSPSPRD